MELNDSTLLDFGLQLMEDDIDNVIFSTNTFLTGGLGTDGPFWWILQCCEALAALFCIIFAAGLAYKMMVKNEPLDVMKLFRPLAISIVLSLWYPSGSGFRFSRDWCILDGLALVPNAIGSYTRALYEAEADQVSVQYKRMSALFYALDTAATDVLANAKTMEEGITSPQTKEAALNATDPQTQMDTEKNVIREWLASLSSGTVILIDKLIMFLSFVVYRIGWWTTIYAQQIFLGMLTIFGPIQWAFSILPKWEGAWAKWITRYLTAHFFGVALYFIGFYVMLLFDIVLTIQVENLAAVTASPGTVKAFLEHSFLTSGYMLVASAVSLKCLQLVPELAAWMIPEGEATMSIRSFGAGIAESAKARVSGAAGRLLM